jgi:hypothetical protein
MTSRYWRLFLSIRSRVRDLPKGLQRFFATCWAVFGCAKLIKQVDTEVSFPHKPAPPNATDRLMILGVIRGPIPHQ